MNYVYILSFVFVVSLAFGRMSHKYGGADARFSHAKKRVVVSEVDTSDDSSVKWKRRHKKRKKSRRPQRGR